LIPDVSSIDAVVPGEYRDVNVVVGICRAGIRARRIGEERNQFFSQLQDSRADSVIRFCHISSETEDVCAGGTSVLTHRNAFDMKVINTCRCHKALAAKAYL
jgi:hypothetical protein